MKAPAKVVFSFDPMKSGVDGLKNEKFKIIWSCIKTGHVVDQHFNSQVLLMVDLIEEHQPKTYEEFRKFLYPSGLANYGTTWEGKHLSGSTILDDEFWSDVFSYLAGESELIFEMNYE